MNRVVLSLLSSTVFLMTDPLWSQLGPGVIVDNAPEAIVDIIPVDSTHVSQLPTIFQQLPITPGSFLLINHSEKPITAVIVMWSYQDQAGAIQRRRLNCDGYFMSPVDQIVRGNGQSLVTPYGYGREDVLQSVNKIQALNSPTEMQTVMPIDMSMPVHLTIDAIIFADGRILGPDKHRYYLEIQDRYAALQSVLANITAVKSSGDELKRFAESARMNLKSKRDKRSSWQSHYYALLEGSPNIDGTLNYLRSQSVPPTFHH
jgi:hypothetical protein